MRSTIPLGGGRSPLALSFSICESLGVSAIQSLFLFFLVALASWRFIFVFCLVSFVVQDLRFFRTCSSAVHTAFAPSTMRGVCRWMVSGLI